MVRLAVPARVQTVTINLARRREQRRDATEMRERGFAFQSVRVVARGNQQDRRGVDPDAVDLSQARRAAPNEHLEVAVETRGVGFERQDAPSQRRDRQFRRVHDGVAARGGSQRRRSAR